MRSLMISTAHQIFLGDQIKESEAGGASSMYGRRLEVYRGFLWGSRKERNHLEDPGVDGRAILRWIFRKWDVRVWTGSSCLRIGTGGGHS